MGTESIVDRALAAKPRYDVIERKDAFGYSEYAVVAYGEFSEVEDRDLRLFRRSIRTITVLTDAREAYRQAGYRNLAASVLEA